MCVQCGFRGGVDAVVREVQKGAWGVHPGSSLLASCHHSKILPTFINLYSYDV